ncbi:TPA: hypothetical protein ACOIT4_001726 [Enterococcus faecalis]|uniref:hypothetical protein n=1 Tax=Enterococcus TaxID=1350 RepID=UPI000330A4E7|nr:hypothetical protein [Enterococcus faecalis]BDH63888.1 hypothetical protein MTP05_00730 [Enterococcus sp. PLM3]EGO2752145.1 hypothetical protein [Enterococcus faecalis]EGO2791214.1 hypothetical protein [Enterococcus faecalis]EGO5112319.1 hypothetical protein [Enterococcus faecalis]EGO5250264.1 hypothetical protein [Enterococcus faecalis]
MRHRKQWLVGILIILIIGIGGAMYMNEKEKAELHEIQTDLANYLYNNYRLYTVNEKEEEKIFKEFNRGKGSLTEQEFFDKLEKLKEYSDINKIEFTSFTVGPMNSLDVEFIINDVYPDYTILGTISAETGKFRYSFNTGNTINNYVLERKENSSTEKMPEENIIYTNKGVE